MHITARSDEPNDSCDEVNVESVEVRTVLACGLLLVLAGLLAYQNSFAGVFLFDDFPNIVGNQSLRSLEATWNATGDDIPGGLKRRVVGRWSFALNYWAGGLDLWGYHAVNLGIHIAAALLLMGIARRTLQLPRIAPWLRRHATLLAFCISLIWLVHPLQTESVTYIVQRLESMMGMFFLASLYCLLRGAGCGRSTWYVAAVAFGWLSLGTKEVGLMLGPVALLFDRAFLSESWREVFKRRGVVHLAIIVAAIGYFAVGIGGVPFHSERPDAAGRRATSWEYLRSQPGVLLHYFKLSFIPLDLCLDYVWQFATDPWEIYGKGTVIVALLAAGVVAWFRNSMIGFLIITYFLILAPSSTIVPLHLAFEHRVYLSLATLIMGVILIVLTAFRRLLPQQPGVQSAAVYAVAGFSLLVASWFVWLTHERNVVYHNRVTMWRDVVRVSPHNSRAHMNLAIYLSKQGELDTAERHYRFGLRIDPEFSLLQYQYGYFLAYRRDNFAAALPYIEESVRLEPTRSVFWQMLANTHEALDRFEEAERSYQQTIDRDPDNGVAHLRYGQMLFHLGRTVEAETLIRRASQLAPYLWQPHHSLARISIQRGDRAEAIQHYRKAISVRPDSPPEILVKELAQIESVDKESS